RLPHCEAIMRPTSSAREPCPPVFNMATSPNHLARQGKNRERGVDMANWAAFAAAAPELAAEGRRLFYQYGVGLGFLATIRKDGGPRLHPIRPIVTDGGLLAFINPSPKCNDLRRDGRYALHAFTPEDVDDEFCVPG